LLAESRTVEIRTRDLLSRKSNAIHYGRSPAYLTETVQSVLSIPWLRTKFGERAFSHAGPATWNALPDNIRTVADPVKFRKLLKSLYFSQAFNIC